MLGHGHRDKRPPRPGTPKLASAANRWPDSKSSEKTNTLSANATFRHPFNRHQRHVGTFLAPPIRNNPRVYISYKDASIPRLSNVTRVASRYAISLTFRLHQLQMIHSHLQYLRLLQLRGSLKEMKRFATIDKSRQTNNKLNT